MKYTKPKKYRKPLFNPSLLALACAGLSLVAVDGYAAQLEEVVVVANKVEESLQDVPLAVSAVSGDALAHSGVAEVADLSGRVPNLQVSSPYGNVQPNFSLRGISVGNEFNANQASPIGVYVDENYLSARFSHGMQLYDIERLEVLRGPQGTLYGRNTTGGVVNVMTKKPQMDETQGFITTKLGNFSSRDLVGAVDTQLIDDVLGVRLAANMSKADGMIDNVGAGNGGDDLRATDTRGARLSVLWNINDTMDLSLRSYYSKSDALGDSPMGVGVMPGGTDLAGYSRNGLDFWETESVNNGDYEISGDGTAATFNWEISDSLELTTITAVDSGDMTVDQDPDGGPADLFHAVWGAEYEQFNQEIRLNYSADSLRLTGGYYYGTDQVDTRNHYDFFGLLAGVVPFTFPPDLAGGNVSTMNFRHRFDQRRDSSAAFGEAAYTFNDNLTFTLGLRYTEDKIKITDAQAVVLDGDGVAQLNTLPLALPADWNAFVAAKRESYSDLSGRFIVDYMFDSGNMIYVSYSKGYRAGAINGTAYFAESQLTFVEPENLDAYEFGWKTRLMDDALQLNGAIFYYDYTDQQVQEIIGITPFLRNAGAAEVTGIELEVLYAATDDLTLGVNLGVLDSEYTDLELSGVDLSGNDFTNTPDMTANINADWRIATIADGELRALLDFSYIGDQWFSPFNDLPSSTTDTIGNDNLQQEAYWLVNGRMAWQSENVTLALWGKNLTDEEYFSYGIDLRSFQGADYLIRGARRTFGVELSYQF